MKSIYSSLRIQKRAHMPDIQQAVREKYGAIASSVTEASSNPGCCGPIACGCGDPITSNRYSDAETSGLQAEAVIASLGCGNRRCAPAYRTATFSKGRCFESVRRERTTSDAAASSCAATAAPDGIGPTMHRSCPRDAGRQTP